MLIAETKTKLSLLCQHLCETHGLQTFYVAQILGRRRQFLAGFGIDGISGVNTLNITERISIFWQGHLTEKEARMLAYRLVPLAKQIEQEL